jgi:hypothetical protein
MPRPIGPVWQERTPHEDRSRGNATLSLTVAMPESNHEAAVAEFIRKRGITRCPTACVLPTQGSIAAADRAALTEYAMTRDRARQAKVAAHTQFGAADVSSSSTEMSV